MRAELGKRRISGTALAKAIGVTRSTMYRRLDGTGQWPVDDVELAADFLGVQVSDLMADTGDAA